MNEFNQYSQDYFEGKGSLGWHRAGGYSKLKEATQHIFFHILNYCTSDDIRSFVVHGEDKNAIDVGCAYGYVLELLFSMGYNCYGTDYSEFAISKARTILPESVNLKVSDVQETAPSELFGVKFNLVVLMEVIEHLNRPESVFENIYRSLIPGGWFVLTTPNLFLSRLRRDIWGDTIFDEPDHINLKPSWEWRTLIRKLPWSNVILITEDPLFDRFRSRKILKRTPLGSSVIIWAKK